MKKIDAVIIVEGKNDIHRLKQVIDADMLCTNGLQMSKDILDTIVKLAKTREIIIFTDPDSPGNRIRHRIQQLVPSAHHLYLQPKQARTKRKVGIEHASLEDILEAFNYISEGKPQENSLSWQEFLDLGLSGRSDSKERRDVLAEKLHIGQANAKTFYNRLNMIHAKYEELERMIKDGQSNCDNF